MVKNEPYKDVTEFDNYIVKYKRIDRYGEMMPDDSFCCLNYGNIFSERNDESEIIKNKLVMITGV